MPKQKIVNGKKYNFPDDATPQEIDEYINRANGSTSTKPSLLDSIWEKANTGVLSPKTIAGGGNYDMLSREKDYLDPNESPTHAAFRRGIAGAGSDAADILSSFTSPISLALIGSGAAMKALPSTGRLLAAIKALHGTASVGFGAQGLKQMLPAVGDMATRAVKSNDPNILLRPFTMENTRNAAMGGSMAAGGVAGVSDVADPASVAAGVNSAVDTATRLGKGHYANRRSSPGAPTRGDVYKTLRDAGVKPNMAQAADTEGLRKVENNVKSNIGGSDRLIRHTEAAKEDFGKAVGNVKDGIQPDADVAEQGLQYQRAASLAKDIANENASANYDQLDELAKGQTVPTADVKAAWERIKQANKGADSLMPSLSPKELHSIGAEIESLPDQVWFKTAHRLRSRLMQAQLSDSLTPHEQEAGFKTIADAWNGSMQKAADQGGFREHFDNAQDEWRHYLDTFEDPSSPIVRTIKGQEPGKLLDPVLTSAGRGSIRGMDQVDEHLNSFRPLLQREFIRGLHDPSANNESMEAGRMEGRFLKYSDPYLQMLFKNNPDLLTQVRNMAAGGKSLGFEFNPSGSGNALMYDKSLREIGGGAGAFGLGLKTNSPALMATGAAIMGGPPIIRNLVSRALTNTSLVDHVMGYEPGGRPVDRPFQAEPGFGPDGYTGPSAPEAPPQGGGAAAGPSRASLFDDMRIARARRSGNFGPETGALYFGSDDQPRLRIRGERGFYQTNQAGDPPPDNKPFGLKKNVEGVQDPAIGMDKGDMSHLAVSLPDDMKIGMTGEEFPSPETIAKLKAGGYGGVQADGTRVIFDPKSVGFTNYDPTEFWSDYTERPDTYGTDMNRNGFPKGSEGKTTLYRGDSPAGTIASSEDYHKGEAARKVDVSSSDDIFRNLGVGRKLYTEFMKHAKADGNDYATSDYADTMNSRSTPLWQRFQNDPVIGPATTRNTPAEWEMGKDAPTGDAFQDELHDAYGDHASDRASELAADKLNTKGISHNHPKYDDKLNNLQEDIFQGKLESGIPDDFERNFRDNYDSNQRYADSDDVYLGPGNKPGSSKPGEFDEGEEYDTRNIPQFAVNLNKLGPGDLDMEMRKSPKLDSAIAQHMIQNSRISLIDAMRKGNPVATSQLGRLGNMPYRGNSVDLNLAKDYLGGRTPTHAFDKPDPAIPAKRTLADDMLDTMNGVGVNDTPADQGIRASKVDAIHDFLNNVVGFSDTASLNHSNNLMDSIEQGNLNDYVNNNFAGHAATSIQDFMRGFTRGNDTPANWTLNDTPANQGFQTVREQNREIPDPGKTWFQNQPDHVKQMVLDEYKTGGSESLVNLLRHNFGLGIDGSTAVHDYIEGLDGKGIN